MNHDFMTIDYDHLSERTVMRLLGLIRASHPNVPVRLAPCGDGTFNVEYDRAYRAYFVSENSLSLFDGFINGVAYTLIS